MIPIHTDASDVVPASYEPVFAETSNTVHTLSEAHSNLEMTHVSDPTPVHHNVNNNKLHKLKHVFASNTISCLQPLNIQSNGVPHTPLQMDSVSISSHPEMHSNAMSVSSNIPEFTPFQSNIAHNFEQPIVTDLNIDEPRDSFEDYGMVTNDSNKCSQVNICNLPKVQNELNNFDDNMYATF
jgi:hypothetical protein